MIVYFNFHDRIFYFSWSYTLSPNIRNSFLMVLLAFIQCWTRSRESRTARIGPNLQNFFDPGPRFLEYFWSWPTGYGSWIPDKGMKANDTWLLSIHIYLCVDQLSQFILHRWQFHQHGNWPWHMSKMQHLQVALQWLQLHQCRFNPLEPFS